MRTISAAQFKAQCLKLMDEVNEQHDEIVITKHGRPTAKLVPFHAPAKPLFGRGRGSTHILGDIVNSPRIKWDAEADA